MLGFVGVLILGSGSFRNSLCLVGIRYLGFWCFCTGDLICEKKTYGSCPKQGNPSIAHKILESFIYRNPKIVPIIFGNNHIFSGVEPMKLLSASVCPTLAVGLQTESFLGIGPGV